MSGLRPGGVSMGATALLLSCFVASVLFSIVIDLLAALASMIAADSAGTDTTSSGLELLSMLGRPGSMAFVGLGLWIGLLIYARRAVREEGRTRTSTAAQVILFGAPVMAVVLGVVLYMAGLPWALGRGMA